MFTGSVKYNALFLLMVYVSGIFYPLQPVVADWYNHLFHHAAHIANVHHHHGDNHMHKEVKKALKEKGENHITDNFREVSLHIYLTIVIDFSIEKKIVQYNFQKIFFPGKIYLPTLSPPPRC